MDEFVEENFINKRNETKTPDNIGLKCIRKKYKCIMLWLLSIITVSQFLIIIFEKLDEKFVNRFVEKISTLIKLSPNATVDTLDASKLDAS